MKKVILSLLFLMLAIPVQAKEIYGIKMYENIDKQCSQYLSTKYSKYDILYCLREAGLNPKTYEPGYSKRQNININIKVLATQAQNKEWNELSPYDEKMYAPVFMKTFSGMYDPVLRKLYYNNLQQQPMTQTEVDSLRF